MTKALAVLAFFLWVPVCDAAGAPLFERANAQYKEGDFKGALETYRKLLEAGEATAVVYYNLGNAALKAGEKGQALVYYERARKASPRDADLEWNVRVLKSALKDKFEDPSHFTVAVLREFLGRWTSDELAVCFTFFLALVSALGAAGLVFPVLQMRIAWLRPLVLTGLVAAGFLFVLKWWETKDMRVVVLDKEIHAYYGPSESETKAFVLHEGAEGKVRDESGEWFYVALPNGNAGWIRKNSSEAI